MQMQEVKLWTVYILLSVFSMMLNIMALFGQFNESVRMLLISFGTILIIPMMAITWKMSSIHRPHM